jgi:hypothetical protein
MKWQCLPPYYSIHVWQKTITPNDYSSSSSMFILSGVLKLITCKCSEIMISKRPLRATLYRGRLMEKISLETTDTDGHNKVFLWCLEGVVCK